MRRADWYGMSFSTAFGTNFDANDFIPFAPNTNRQAKKWSILGLKCKFAA
jgi:hypothetical protein